MATAVRMYDTYSVFVGKIHPDTKRANLKDLFQPCGEIVDIALIHRPESEYAFGFVRFSAPSAVYRAVSELNRWELNGTNLVVQVSKDTQEKIDNEKNNKVPARKRVTNRPERRTTSSNATSDHISDTMNLCRLQEAVTALNLENQHGGNLPLDKLVNSMKKVSGDRNPPLWGSLSKPVSTFEDVTKSLRQKSVQMGFGEEFGDSLCAEYMTALGSLLTRISQYTDVENLLKENNMSDTGCENLLKEDIISDTGHEHLFKEENLSELPLQENGQAELTKRSPNRNLVSSMLDEPILFKSPSGNYDNKSQNQHKDVNSDSGLVCIKSPNVKVLSIPFAEKEEELNQEVVPRGISDTLPNCKIENEELHHHDRKQQLSNSVSKVFNCQSPKDVKYVSVCGEHEDKKLGNKFSSQDTVSGPPNCLSENGKLHDKYRSEGTSNTMPYMGTSNSVISDDPSILDFHVSPRSMQAVSDQIGKRQQKESFGAHVENGVVKNEQIRTFIENMKSNSGSKLQRSHTSDSKLQRSDSSDSKFQRSDSSDSKFQRSDSSGSDDYTKGNLVADSGIESDFFCPTSDMAVKKMNPIDFVRASQSVRESRVSGRQAGNRRKFQVDDQSQRTYEFNQQLYVEKNKGRGRSTPVSVQSSDHKVGGGMSVSVTSGPANATSQLSEKVPNTLQGANKAVLPFGELKLNNMVVGVGRGFKNLVLCKDKSNNTGLTEGCDLTLQGVRQKLPELFKGQDSCYSQGPCLPAMSTGRFECNGKDIDRTSPLVYPHLSLGVRGVGRGFINKM